jgi:hypothetical protein
VTMPIGGVQNRSTANPPAVVVIEQLAEAVFRRSP